MLSCREPPLSPSSPPPGPSPAPSPQPTPIPSAGCLALPTLGTSEVEILNIDFWRCFRDVSAGEGGGGMLYLSSPCSSCSLIPLALTLAPLSPPDEAAVQVSREATTLTEVFSRLPLPLPSSQVGFNFPCRPVIPWEPSHHLPTFEAQPGDLLVSVK